MRRMLEINYVMSFVKYQLVIMNDEFKKNETTSIEK